MKPVNRLLEPQITRLPSLCGVYLMQDKNHRVIYAGKAKNLKARVRSYFVPKNAGLKNIFLIPRIKHIDYILTRTEAEAFLLEASLIKKHSPRYNVRLKDDKSYPYIRCSLEEDFPRFYVERRVKKKGSVYFGPYTNAHFVRWMIRFLNQQFKIRDCSLAFMKTRTSPCLTYQMGACTAPCVKKTAQKKYHLQVQKALDFLKKGGVKSAPLVMQKRMQSLAKQERFEEAGRLRDFIKSFKLIREKQAVVMNTPQNLDAAVFYTDKKRGVLFHTLHVRSGAAVGQRFHFFSPPNMEGEDDMLSAAGQYYLNHVVPDTILLSLKTGHSFLEKLLKPMYPRTRVRLPKSSPEKQLIKMALCNAQEHFEEQLSAVSQVLEGLKGIQKKFALPGVPYRLECFDVSHFQGEKTVGALAVFEEGEPQKSAYRKYKIARSGGGDDCLSMKELVQRRFRLKKQPDPDLLVIDGGKGQLNAVMQTLKEIKKDLFVTAIAKHPSGQERFFIPGRKNPVKFSGQAFRILTYLRDEAHRTAVSYHRRLFQRRLPSD